MIIIFYFEINTKMEKKAMAYYLKIYNKKFQKI